MALDKPVTLNGVFFTGGWGSGLIVDADTVVDGLFFPRHHQWDQGPVWWDSSGANTGQSVVIDLDGAYVIESFIVQADDNDAYLLYYWDIGSDDWVLAWSVPNYDIVPDPLNWGMQTRPNPDDDTERYVLASPVTTTALKLEGNMGDTVDALFAVSEIQAYGSPALEVEKDLVDWADFGDGDGVLEVGEPWGFLLGITVTNNTAETITDVAVADRLGAELMLDDAWDTAGGNIDSYTKGKSEKVFVTWDGFDLAPGASQTLWLVVYTDINPGQGKKALPTYEYTEAGEHELNSGATAKGMLGDLQVSDTSDPITVNVVEPD